MKELSNTDEAELKKTLVMKKRVAQHLCQEGASTKFLKMQNTSKWLIPELRSTHIIYFSHKIKTLHLG